MLIHNKRLRHRTFILRRIISGGIYRMLGPLNTFLQPKKKYGIKPGYHHARYAEIYDDRPNADQWQFGVYNSAVSLIKKMNGKSVIDVGCGSAFKLVEMFGDYDTIGIELTDTRDWLLKKYPSRKWLAFENTDPKILHANLIICSDVIEHVKDPDELMYFLSMISFEFLVISTPERNRVRGNHDFGPPENTAHFREWNDQEFKEYVSKWFYISEQMISSDKSVSQILFCKIKSPSF